MMTALICSRVSALCFQQTVGVEVVPLGGNFFYIEVIGCNYWRSPNLHYNQLNAIAWTQEINRIASTAQCHWQSASTRFQFGAAI